MDLINHHEQTRDEWRAGVTTRMRISALTGATALTVFEQWCEPGLGAPLHWHLVEEVLSVLDGQAEITIGDEVFEATGGHSAVIPANVRHGFRNVGAGTLHMLATLAAPAFEAHYDDRAEVSRRWWPGEET